MILLCCRLGQEPVAVWCGIRTSPFPPQPGFYTCSPFGQKTTTSPDKCYFTWVFLFSALFCSPKREAISSQAAVLPKHIMGSCLSYLILFSYKVVFKLFLPVRFSPQISVFSECSLKGRWQTRTRPCSCAKAGEALRIMWCWFKTSPCYLETGSHKMSISKTLEIQVPMGRQPKFPGIFFTYFRDDWSFWLRYDNQSYSNLSKAWNTIRWRNQIS